MCFGIRHDHFLTFFSWNSTDSLDGTGKLLCSRLLQSPEFVFNVLNKYYKQDVTPIHPSFPLPAVELNTRTCSRECSGMQRLPHSLSKCKCLQWQCSSRFTVSCGLSLSFLLLHEMGYQLTIIYDVIAWLLLAEVLVLLCLGASLSDPMQVVLWFHQNTLTWIYI